ncbi:SIMPL domain-containing protein [Paenibacillus sp. J22TS3]|uniref:SIMPL domain-containing protein n=1 Tax=Paenibacillus sp. J22TS3 TaxID=2807192 RepID=UPI001BD09E34|nr:SIMPL domain-containing protein [Paenibacillus sp. J22TS3]
MKIWVKSLGSVLIAGTLLAGGTTVGGLLTDAPRAYADEAVQRNVINVTGSGEVFIKPDIAYLSIGVEAQAATAQEAQKATAAQIAKLTNLLKNTWKIDAADIQTTGFYVQPNYTYNDKEGQKLKGYNASHTLQVKYRQLDKIGQLLDDASKNGANRIDNVRFTVENPDQYQEQVINKALANAELKAGIIAKGVKRQMGAVLSVSQGGVSSVPMYEQNYLAMEKSTASSAADSAVEPGQIKVTTTLNVQYELK